VADLQRVGDLEIEQNPGLDRRIWLVQRWAWGVIAVLLLLGLLGIFGTGVFSQTSVTTPDGSLEVRYERFGRTHSTMRIEVRLRPDPTRVGDGLARIRLGRASPGGVMVEDVDPIPLRVEAGTESSAYLFPVLEPGAPIRVNFYLKPDQIGRMRYRIGRDERQALSFWQFIYP
jgi:hypothetical protein